MARPKNELLNNCKNCGENIEKLPQWIRRYNMCKKCYYIRYPINERVKKSRKKYDMTALFIPKELYTDMAIYAKALAKAKNISWGNI